MGDATTEARVEPVTPTSAAANPQHPDHPQWVKDQMLAREVGWLRSLGVDVHRRKVDTVVDAGLRRLAARKREGRRPVPIQRDRTTLRTAERMALERGVTLFRRPIREPRRDTPYECNRCGRCIRCSREARGMRILQLARAGDHRLAGYAQDIVRACLRAQAGVGVFEGLSKTDQHRVLTRIIEDVCDRSTSTMGPWRP